MDRLAYEEWEQRWNQLFDKYEEKGYLSFSSDERIWFNVRGLIDAIENGGLISFYYNYGADYLDDTLEDLQKIDAIEVVHLLQKIE
ncbi:DMP19 family protein [Bacillaceae bacterium C204]|uniref:DMP19 family protein n=1 Tax=Neobacillus sp. 204 TaxID=3383351 RepID=UPI00397DD8E8